MRKGNRNFKFLLVLGLILIFWIWNPFWRFDLDEAVDLSSTEQVPFDIATGESVVDTAKHLEEAELIVDSGSFVKALKAWGLDQQLCAGRFILSPGMTLEEIIKMITGTCNGNIAITIPEGWASYDIDAKLADLGLIQAGEFLDCMETCIFDYTFLEEVESLEGYLFPDTYFVNPSEFTVEGFINQLLQNFDEKITEEHEEAIEESGRTLEEVIIIASMIEKEVKSEKNIVSGILWKRLDEDWFLGVDAALNYLVGYRELTAEDLALDTPYNLRTHLGLPPSAISNPGIESIEAAIHPEESPYWFYLTPWGSEEVIFSETNEEHEENIEIYLNP